MTAPSSKAKLEIVTATDAHAGELATFYAAVWDAAATADTVQAARSEAARLNLAVPGEAPPTFLAVKAGRILGHVSSLPIRLWNGTSALPAYWIKGLMVLPEYRGGPLGHMVLQEATRQLPRTVALTVAPASRRLFGALGYADLGAVPNYVRPLAPGRILARLDMERLGLGGVAPWVPKAVRLAQRSYLPTIAGGLGGWALRAGAAAARLPSSHLRERAEWPADVETPVGRLWESVRASLGACVERNAAYLLQRYGRPSDHGPYHWVGVWDADTLAGLAIIREPREQGDPRLAGIRVATMSDLLVAPRRTDVLAVLGAVERRALALGADGILATLSAPVLKGLLRWQGFAPLPGNVHFFVRDVTGGDASLPPALNGWWLSRGDGESDQVF